MNDILLQVLADDKQLITYRKQLNKITGGVTATILLQQLIYHASKKKYQPFYKFIEPCNNQLYRTGDSWVEELGFTKYEFRSAYKKLEELGIVTKNTNMNRVTFYEINRSYLGKLIMSTYEKSVTIKNVPLNNTDNDVSSISKDCQLTYVENTNLDNSKIKRQRLLEEDEEETINLNKLDDYINNMTQNGKTIKGSFEAYRAGVLDALTDKNNDRHVKTLRSYKGYLERNNKPLPMEALAEVVEIDIKKFKEKKIDGKYDIGIINSITPNGFDNYDITYQGLGVHQYKALIHTDSLSGKELLQRTNNYS